jgi:hypothetical protein
LEFDPVLEQQAEQRDHGTYFDIRRTPGTLSRP